MSDLTATNCGCSNDCGCSGTRSTSCGMGGNWISLLLLLSLFGGGGCGDCGGGCGNGMGRGFNLLGNNNCGCGSDSCQWLIWILLLSCFCGNNN